MLTPRATRVCAQEETRSPSKGYSGASSNAVLTERTARLINPAVRSMRALMIEAKVRDESTRRVRRQRYLETIAAHLVKTS